MAAVHEHTLRAPVAPSHVQLACDGTYLALPHGRTGVGVWSLKDITCKPLELVGHGKPVSALCFSHRSHPTLLVSCASDYIITWNIDRARTAIDAGQQVRGQVIGTTLGLARYCSFSADDLLVAICVDKEVLILDARQHRLDTTLEGHNAAVTCAEFCPHYTSTIVTASEDRTFKVWDLSISTLVYQSTIISSSPFISLTMNPLHESFALGTADGQIRVYDLTDGNSFRCLHHIDVDRLLSRLRESKATSKRENNSPQDKSGPVKISSRPSWRRPEGTQTCTGEVEEQEDSEAGTAIISMLYTYNHGGVKTPTPCNLPFLQDNSLVNELLDNAPMLVVVSTAAILQMNARTFEPCAYNNLQEPLLSYSVLEDEPRTVSLVGSAIMGQSTTTQDLTWCVVGNLFGNEVSVLRLGHPNEAEQMRLKLLLVSVRTPATNLTETKSTSTPMLASNKLSLPPETDDDLASSEELTVLSSGPLSTHSPLKAELILKKDQKTTKKPSRGYLASATRRGSSPSVDQPLVFNSKIRSSGYTDTPRKTMFSPQTHAKSPKGHTPLSKCKSTPDVSKSREYPMTCDPPTQLSVKLDVADRPTVISSVCFSGDGQHLLCGLANTTAQIFRMPLTGRGAAFTGHNGVVTSACWSRDNKWVITSSDDRTASVWSRALPDPVMTMKTIRDNFTADKEGGHKPTKDNPLFPKPVKYAQFYYMDKFILLTAGNTFYLYKFHLDTTKSDIKRYLSNNRYKLVSSWQLEQAQQITAFSACNSFYSYLAVCAGSNKAIEVFDLNVGKSVRTILDVHTRAPHVICQNEGSAYVSHPASAYDLFVTAAASDCIKLWDLRSNRCVRRYEGNVNRVLPCGVSISPCSRYIATGSEDRSAYIFDIRSGTYLHKLLGHTDTVGQVAFHPLYPQLLTATMDGKLRLFTT